MKVVVTGGAGFVGSHVSVLLWERGFDVVAVDNLERASGVKRLGDVPLITLDVRRCELPRADVYIHAAAYISVEESWSRPYDYVVNDTAATGCVAKLAWERGAHLVYISSAAVYGEPKYLPIDEEHPKEPTSPYGLSKLWGEQIASLYARLGLKLTILRLFNVYGPGQSGPYAGVISKFIERAKKREPLIIYGDGSQTRDFIHVADVAELVAVVIEKKALGSYNVGSGKSISIRELADIVSKVAGLAIDQIYMPPRPGDIKHSVADVRRALGLGWAPRRELQKEIEKLFNSAHEAMFL
ncbi:MAG: NAD-dependent epimerase/dehydratase family protein [Pyrobaculum sp.]